MIIVNGKKFAKTEKELTNSLFTPGGTATGFYRVHKNGVVLMDHNKDPRVFLVANRHNEHFFVSCHKTNTGRLRYMYSTSTLDEQWLSLPDSLQSQHDEAKRVWSAINNN